MKKTADTKDKDKMLTEVELELMTILWRLGEGTVNDVIDNLSKERKLAYTSVSTVLRILEQKEFLATRKEGRGHIYVPRLEKNEYERRSVRHMIDHVFDGTPLALAKQLLHATNLTKQDLQELRRLIDQSAAPNGDKK